MKFLIFNSQRGIVSVLIVLLFLLAGASIFGGAYYFTKFHQPTGIVEKNTLIVEEPIVTEVKNLTTGKVEIIEVTISELVKNYKKYNGKRISVKGRFNEKQISHLCAQGIIQGQPLIVDEYVTYDSSVIYDPNEALGVVIKGEEKMQKIKNGQIITVAGVVRLTTIKPCYQTFNSIYIETTPEDIKLEEEPEEITGICGHLTITPSEPSINKSGLKRKRYYNTIYIQESEDSGLGPVDADTEGNFSVEKNPGDYLVSSMVLDEIKHKVVVENGKCTKVEVVIPEEETYKTIGCTTCTKKEL